MDKFPMNLKNYNDDKRREAYWGRAIFQLLGVGLASVCLYSVPPYYFHRAMQSSGSHSVLWYGLGSLFILVILIGGQVLGVFVYNRWFPSFFARHELDPLKIFTVFSRLGGIAIAA